ncbi:hypothetical protein [Halomonas saccharevitans]|uniref:Uncharacterized protein n=1 Tax=Halomonas saccharevitans TaxID=416872 RepID=A0A1I7C8T1_9GAMM|nr:hypothetical protein [Halomonas saccharevitans]SFT95851.1 hypothetical protein SAMN04487956_13836 [Halomonas saccharevitans]
MALSPWSVAREMDYEEVACILAGYDPAEVSALLRHGPEFEHQVVEVFAWKRQLVEAVGRGDLKSELILVYGYPPGGDRTSKSWFREDETTLYMNVFEVDEIRMQLQRTEVARWLKASGHADDDIPEALRVTPKPRTPVAPEDKPPHHRRRHTYLTLIEALALEVLGGEIPAEPYKAAAVLQAVLERQGLKLDKDPIAKTVKEIQAARDDRATERP